MTSQPLPEKPFVNRQREMTYLTRYLERIPDSILFVYGPKSTGKSTLLHQVISRMDRKTTAVNFIDLRRVLLYNFESFLRNFFPKSLRGAVSDVLGGLTVNTGFFGVSVDEETLLTENAFKLMDEKLKRARERGISPVLIIDEVQLLRPIYINGERYLLDELFNLFAALTKVTHTAHVICATSDSYFIDELYNNAKLSKAATFYRIDHLVE